MGYLSWILLAVLGIQTGVAPRSPVASLDGTVIRVTTQQAIQGATVTLFLGTNLVQGPSVVPADVSFRSVGGNASQQPPAQSPRAQLSVLTDNAGHFVFREIPPGRYRLVASAIGYVAGDGIPLTVSAGVPIANIRLTLSPLASVNGRVMKDRIAVTGATVVLLRTFFSAEGERRIEEVAKTTVDQNGDYSFSNVAPRTYYLATYFAAPRTAEGNSALQVPLTFYPGTLELRDAVEIVVKDAPVTVGDITVSSSPLRRIVGTLTDSRGRQPDEANFQLTCWLPTSNRFTVAAEQRYNAANGVFELSGLQPCTYQIVATGRFKASVVDKPTFRATAMVQTVSGSIDDLRLIEPVERSITGQVRFTGRASAADAANLGQVRVEFETNLRQGSMLTLPPITSNVVGVEHALNFAPTDQLEVGDYRLMLRYLPPDYYLNRVLINGSDASTQSIQFSPFVPNKVEIFISTNGGKVAGTVLDNQGVSPNLPVTLVPRPPLGSDRYKTVRADASGHFIFRGIAPGQYLVFASGSLDTFSYLDPALKNTLAQHGKVVTVAEGSSLNVEVNVVLPINK